jgi:hypothetical protein
VASPEKKSPAKIVAALVAEADCRSGLPKGDVVGQRQFIHTLFGIAA